MGRKGFNPRLAQAGGGTEIHADRAATRRAQYAADPSTREAAKAASRESYRSSNPLPPSKLNNGLLTAAIQREVTVVGMRRLRSLKTYTVPEAAEALGKSLSNFRRWIDNQLIPAPHLKDATRGYLCYCSDELLIMARILAVHERQFAYFCEAHEDTSNQIWQAITGYRDITFGGGNG